MPKGYELARRGSDEHGQSAIMVDAAGIAGATARTATSRGRAAQFSKELSAKVSHGCIRIAQQGFWVGGSPPYGYSRLLLDEARKPLHVLEHHQKKGIQNQRVTL